MERLNPYPSSERNLWQTGGDLIWGGWFNNSQDFQQFLRKGVMPKCLRENVLSNFHPNHVCMAMLPLNNHNFWKNYRLVSHHGPKPNHLVSEADFHVAIILDRKRILEVYKEKATAVGEKFKHPLYNLINFHDLSTKSVMGFTVGTREGEPAPYPEEVDIIFDRVNNLPLINHYFWKAMITFPSQVEAVTKALNCVGLASLPVIAVP